MAASIAVGPRPDEVNCALADDAYELLRGRVGRADVAAAIVNAVMWVWQLKRHIHHLDTTRDVGKRADNKRADNKRGDIVG